MGKKFLFAALLATAALSGCEKCGNVSVTQPSAADAEWLVYRQNDSIRFETETGENVVYTRSSIFAYEQPGEGYTATDECIESIYVQTKTVMEGVEGTLPSLGTSILSKPNDLVVELSVADEGVWEINEQEPSFETSEVNGKIYSNVYEVVTTSTEEGDVKRIRFNKEFGFISVEFNGGRVLKLVPA